MYEQSFNLIDSPWIPVTGRGLISLREIFTDINLQQLGGNTVEKIVILRLLLAIAHAATNIPDDKTWMELSPERVAAQCLIYLEKWHDAFYLHGDQPFLQIPALASDNYKKEETWLLRLNASDNKSMLSEHEWEQRKSSISDVELSRLLLQQSCYGCAGYKPTLIDNKVKGGNYIVLTPGYTQKYKDGIAKPGQMGYGTLLGGVGYLHSYYQGNSILETILFNMLTEKDIRDLNAFSEGMGRPAWEDMPVGEACPRALSYVKSYQGQLLPLDKYLYVNPQNQFFTITEGIKYPSSEDLLEPAFTRAGKEQHFLKINQNKRVWRELPAILSFLSADSNNTTPYMLSKGLPRLRAKQLDTISVWVGGMSVSSTAGVQNLKGLDDYMESSFSFPSQLLGDIGFKHFKELLEKLDAYAEMLRKSIHRYCGNLQPAPSNSKKDTLTSALTAKAHSMYWEKMEQRIQNIIDISFSREDNTTLLEEEQKHCRSIMMNVYDTCCAHQTTRQLLAWTNARPFNMSAKDKKPGKPSAGLSNCQ